MPFGSSKTKPKKFKGDRKYRIALDHLSYHKSRVHHVYDQKPLNTWVEPYLEEEELGILLLHRQNRLVKIQKQLATQQYDCKKRDDNWQDCETISSRTADDIINNNAQLVKVNDELGKVRGGYWEHQLRLNKLVTTRPTIKVVVKEVLVPRLHRDRYNRPYIWGHDQKECAARGGCCGWNCGCCEKALNWYLALVEEPEGEQRKFMGVFGHCTVECACCIESRKCYRPHPRLPPTAF